MKRSREHRFMAFVSCALDSFFDSICSLPTIFHEPLPTIFTPDWKKYRVNAYSVVNRWWQCTLYFLLGLNETFPSLKIAGISHVNMTHVIYFNHNDVQIRLWINNALKVWKFSNLQTTSSYSQFHPPAAVGKIEFWPVKEFLQQF